MSASKWVVCPRCRARAQRAGAAAREKADQAYGKVPVAEFDELRRTAERLSAPLTAPDFREDFEVYGASDGVLEIRYGGHCTECGLDHTFTHSDIINASEPL